MKCKRFRRLRLLSILIMTSGCGPVGDRIPVSKTSGKLVWSENQTMGLMIVLHPTDPTAPRLPVQPTGVIQSDGTFEITCYETSDGAPAGEYIVTIREAPRAEDAKRPKLPPPKYLKNATSPLRIRIEKQPLNNLGEIVIES